MGTFKIEEIERFAKQVSERASYPIRNADDLVGVFGGDDADLSYEGVTQKASDVRQAPSYTFPIESEEDFIAKMASLRARSGDEVESKVPGNELHKLPPDAGGPPEISPEELPPPGQPGVRGWKLSR